VIFTSSLSYGITEFVEEEMGGGRIDEGDAHARSSERARCREAEEDEEESTTT